MPVRGQTPLLYITVQTGKMLPQNAKKDKSSLLCTNPSRTVCGLSQRYPCGSLLEHRNQTSNLHKCCLRSSPNRVTVISYRFIIRARINLEFRLHTVLITRVNRSVIGERTVKIVSCFPSICFSPHRAGLDLRSVAVCKRKTVP